MLGFSNVIDSKDTLYHFCTPEEILLCYMHEIYGWTELSFDLFMSPFRDDGNNPGCQFKYNDAGEIHFIDYGRVRVYYDALDFAKHYKYPHASFQERLQLIFKDVLRFRARNVSPGQYKPTVAKKKAMTGEVVYNDLDDYDYEVWEYMGILEETLTFYDVQQGRRVYINGHMFHEYTPLNPMYAYLVYDQVIQLYKPYESNRKKRFRQFNQDRSFLGKKQIEQQDHHELIWITSSYKDIMSLYQATGWMGAAQWGEGHVLSDEDLAFLRSKTKNIVGFMDNDEAGRLLGEEYKKSGIISIMAPEWINGIKIKDPNDVLRNFGNKLLLNLCYQLMKSS